MNKFALALTVLATLLVSQADAQHPHDPQAAMYYDYLAFQQSQAVPWHGGYYHPNYGQPLALVVPPTANMQTNHTGGVTGTEVTPIWHQFRRNYPGPLAAGSGPGFRHPPYWPMSTWQMGTYYVRGPW